MAKYAAWLCSLLLGGSMVRGSVQAAEKQHPFWGDVGGDCALALGFYPTRRMQADGSSPDSDQQVASDRCGEKNELYVGAGGRVIEMHGSKEGGVTRYRSRDGATAVLALGGRVPGARRRPVDGEDCVNKWNFATLTVRLRPDGAAQRLTGIYGGGCP